MRPNGHTTLQATKRTPRATVGAEILGARVDVDGEDAGRVTGVLTHPANHAIGLEVTSPGLARRFLPLAAATLSNGVVDVSSRLHLVDSVDVYLDAGATVWRELSYVEDLEAVRTNADEPRPRFETDRSG